MSRPLYDKATGRPIGTLREDDYDFLALHLEEESLRDVDYYIDAATIDMLQARGGSPALIDMLRAAVGNGEGIDITWQPD